MKTHLACFCLLLTALGLVTQAQNNQGDYRILIGESVNHVRNMDLAEMKIRGAIDAAKFIDLGNATLKVLEKSIPTALSEYDRLLRGEEGILKSNAGRYHAQNTEAVHTVLRYVMESRFSGAVGEGTVNFGDSEQSKRIELLQAAIEKLREHGSGQALNPATSKWAKIIKEQAAWGRDSFELINARNMLLDSYLRTVPKGVKLDALPTMEEEVTAVFLRRIRTRAALLNEVEKEAANEKSTKLAEVTKQIRKEELDSQIAQIKQLAEQEAILTQTLHEREIAAVAQKYEEQIAQLERAKAEMMAKLEAYQAATETMRKTVEVKETLRKLPANARTLVALLSAKGTWKPVKEDYSPRILKGAVSQYGLDPQPHSLTQLAACGALEDTHNGVYTLYAILAAKVDTLRPRMQGGFHLTSNSPTSVVWLESDVMREMNTTAGKQLTAKIRSIQKILRDYGKELVAEELLAP